MPGLVENIKNHDILSEFVCGTCRENESQAQIEIDGVQWCNVNPEVYFSSLRSGHTHASVDCLFTVECSKHHYDHYLIELKSAPKNLNAEYASIYKKFEDTIDHFMCEAFTDLYCAEIRCNIRLKVVHRVTRTDKRLLLKRFRQPITRYSKNLYIDFQDSPYTIKKC